jgi:hypothetical protein
MNKVSRWFRQTREWIVAIHSDETGESSMTTNVLLVAGAALILVLVVAFGRDALNKIKEWYDGWFKPEK